jgi:hypothetical protein
MLKKIFISVLVGIIIMVNIFYPPQIDKYTSTILEPDISMNYTATDAQKLKTKYDTTNIDIEYHDDPTLIANSQGVPFGAMVVFDNSGNKKVLKNDSIIGSPIYYDPAVMTYGPTTFVPNYENSIYMSGSGGKTAAAAAAGVVTDVSSADFCAQNAASPYTMEEKCQLTETGKCGEKSCCVLLGGTKCVYGDETGPFFSSNYSDIFVRNRDYYFYKNKRYGRGE